MFFSLLLLLFQSYGPARPIFPSWDEPNQSTVVTSKLKLPESSASTGCTSWLPVTGHEELATDQHEQQQVRKCTQLLRRMQTWRCVKSTVYILLHNLAVEKPGRYRWARGLVKHGFISLVPCAMHTHTLVSNVLFKCASAWLMTAGSGSRGHHWLDEKRGCDIWSNGSSCLKQVYLK